MFTVSDIVPETDADYLFALRVHSSLILNLDSFYILWFIKLIYLRQGPTTDYYYHVHLSTDRGMNIWSVKELRVPYLEDWDGQGM